MQEVWIILTIKPVFHDIENFQKTIYMYNKGCSPIGDLPTYVKVKLVGSVTQVQFINILNPTRLTT